MRRLERFLETRRSAETAKGYRQQILGVVSDPDAFLELPKAQAEDYLLDFVIRRRTQVAAISILAALTAMKSFLDFYEVPLNWKKVRSAVPQARKVAQDRAPTREEIRALLARLGVRDRAVVLVMASSGIRVGAWAWLDVADVTFRGSGIACLRVYRGEPEEYRTFATPEAAAALKSYLEDRRRTGEDLHAGSPLLRDLWDVNRSSPHRPPVPLRLSTASVRNMLSRWWTISGGAAKGSREFKAAHGFRKLFKTEASRAMARDDVEVLMGHALAYYRPTLEHLEEEYLKAVPFLTVGESEQLKEEIKVQEAEHRRGWTEQRLETLELKERVRELEGSLRQVGEVLPELRRLMKEGRELSPPSDSPDV